MVTHGRHLLTAEASGAVKHKKTTSHKKTSHGSHHKKHQATSPSPVLLGGTKSGDVVSGCNNLCNAAVGSLCVAISGGSITTPQCTCNTAADCPCYSTFYYANGTMVTSSQTTNGKTSQGPIGMPISCTEYTPTAPSNYKGNICCYGDSLGISASRCSAQPYTSMGNGSPEQCVYGSPPEY